MDSGYRKRVAEHVFPLSVEQNDLDVALREWFYTGEHLDHEELIETCEMCEQEGLRYHFRIANTLTHNLLWVGSECILRFELGAADEAGVVVHGAAAEKIVVQHRQELVEAARRERVLEAFRELWRKDAASRRRVLELVSYVKAFGRFMPRQILEVDALLRQHSVEPHPGDFRVALRRDMEKEQVTTTNYALLRPYLSSEQRKKWDLWITRARAVEGLTRGGSSR